jgi:hypothetical protein
VKLDTAGRYWVTMMVEEVVQALPPGQLTESCLEQGEGS